MYIVGEFRWSPRQVFVLDLATLTWREGTQKRTDRLYVGVAAEGGFLYCVGGRS